MTIHGPKQPVRRVHNLDHGSPRRHPCRVVTGPKPARIGGADRPALPLVTTDGCLAHTATTQFGLTVTPIS